MTGGRPRLVGDEQRADLYAAVGGQVQHYVLHVDERRLERGRSVSVLSRVQYAWPHPSLPLLYACCADRGAGENFALVTLAQDEAGDLEQVGDPVALPSRPVHLTTDPSGEHLLTAYPRGPGLTVHHLGPKGLVGKCLSGEQPIDVGVYPHQVRVTPSGERAIVVARGHKEEDGDYVAGALTVVTFKGGDVRVVDTVDASGTVGPPTFNPRHLDFDPHLDQAYVALAAQNQMAVFPLSADGDVADEPTSLLDLLSEPAHVRPTQGAQAVHVHPQGGYVYVANKATAAEDGRDGPSWVTDDRWPVFSGGENTITVFRVDPGTGELTHVQHVATRGIAPRTFALEPSGRVLVVGNRRSMHIRDESGAMHAAPAGLALFDVAADGRLTFRSYLDVGADSETLTWMGIVGRG